MLRDDQQRWRAKGRPNVRRRSRFSAMPIDPQQLQAHIDERGPFLYHVASRDRLDGILRDGLRPSEDAGLANYDGFHRSRRGHVYFIALEQTPIVPTVGLRAVVRVDLRQLKPELFNTDEDAAQNAASRGQHWVEVQPPKRDFDDDGRERAGQEGALATWIEAAGGDAPEIVARSLAEGRIAYKGPAPVSALAVVEPSSEAADRFRQHAAAVLGIDADELPPTPIMVFCDVDLARSRVLVKTIVEHALIAAASTPSSNVSVADRREALTLAGELQRMARPVNQRGEVDRAAVLSAAGKLANEAGELGHLGWSRSTALDLTDLAVETIATIATLRGTGDARAAAAAVLLAMTGVRGA